MVVRKRAKRDVETKDFLRMLGRMMKAASARVGESDEEEFQQLLALEQVLTLAIQDAATGLRESGMTWQQIGEAAGTTRQGAQQRWGGRSQPRPVGASLDLRYSQNEPRR